MGSIASRFMEASCFERGYIEPAALSPALESELCELHTFRAFEHPHSKSLRLQRSQEKLPLRFERVVPCGVIRDSPAHPEWKSIAAGCTDSTQAWAC